MDLSVEIISPTADYFGKFISFMPNPDILLAETGETIRIYRQMMLDARIFSLVELRKIKVLNFPFHIKPKDDTPQSKKIADFVRMTLESIDLYSNLKELLSALEFGFSVSEVIWENRKGFWVPVDLKSRRQERFAFRSDGEAVLVEDPKNPMTVLNQPYKFIIHRHSPEAENPYGSSILKQCYWPYVFKKAGFRFWMITAEKFGVPTVMAIFEADDEEKARQRASLLAQSLAGIQTDAALAIANVKEVKALESQKGLDEFKVLIDACNNEISYALTGQALATSESKYGTRAQAQVHEDILKEFVKGDAKELAFTLNRTLIRWIVELNFGKDAPSPIFEFEINDYASWDILKDAIDRGVPVSKNALYANYNLPKPSSVEDVFVSPKQESLNLSDALKKKNSRMRGLLFT